MQHTPIERSMRKLNIPFRQLEKIEREKLTRKIVSESVTILIFSSIISSLGGITLEMVKGKLIAFLPMLIFLPALNDMIGDFGSIMASRFTTMLETKSVLPTNWWKSAELHNLVIHVCTVAMIVSIFMATLAYGVGMIKGFPFEPALYLELVSLAMLATVALIAIIIVVSIAGGLYVFSKGHDPDNYLIPIATGIADLGSMAVLAIALVWFF